jgi:erythronate-4-phosphate dehydrogenase
MKIIVDDKIPYIKGALEPFGEVLYLSGKATTPEIVKDADALITRTRTICNEQLLKGSAVKFIATATIGFDHIDTAYCEKAGIEWTNAPGCNSWSVAQYLMAALHTLALARNLELKQMTIGVVGAGNVGSKVARYCEALGMNVLINDPPRERAEGKKGFHPIEMLQHEADILTFHTPLTMDGPDRTFHKVNQQFLDQCKSGLVFINTSRGEVMDTAVIKQALKTGKIAEAIIDCWENEPNIDQELLQEAFIATPHIAGYSRDGKAKGTSMSVQAVSRKFNLGIDDWECSEVEQAEASTFSLNGLGKNLQEIVTEAVLHTYPINEDSERLKNHAETFEKQRGDYPVRREFPAFTIVAENIEESALQTLKTLGFQFA